MEDDNITAYHGSPHDFEQFDIGKVGTGEGAQAYGHGLYFAESEPVAEGYRDKLTAGTYKTNTGSTFDPYNLEHLNLRVAGYKGIDAAIDRANGLLETQTENADMINRDLAKLMAAKESEAIPAKGHMYEVSINAHPDHFLDWDRPLSEQPHVLQAIDQHIGDPSLVMDQLFGHQDATGRDFHEKLGGERKPQAVAQRLSEMGIKGIKYLDAGSRGDKEEPTRNYVVFDDKLVNVRRKYKKGGAVEGQTVDTEHPNFREWFGKSVTHDDGVPRRYFTGTSKDVDFKKFKVAQHGAWFTTDPGEASSYAEENDSQNYKYENGRYQKTNTASRVIPAYLKAENPYRGEKPDWLLQQQNYKKAQSDWFDTLRAQGHDSWIPDSMGGNLAVILGHPGQIKSAISNTGEYDPNKDIHRAHGGSLNRAFGGRNKERDNVWWHGTVSGDLRGGQSGLHLGTKAAAEDALHARIGFPAEGEWDGTREYGKTLLAGKKTIRARNPYGLSGRNVDAPEEDYYAHEHPDGPLKHWNGDEVDPASKPWIKPFKITGPMTNSVDRPHGDWKANGYMKAALKRGNAKSGYYYTNEGEDSGSISAVVPNGSHIDPLEVSEPQNEKTEEPVYQPRATPMYQGGKASKELVGKALALSRNQ